MSFSWAGPPTVTPVHKIVCGVDFGTTFTGKWEALGTIFPWTIQTEHIQESAMSHQTKRVATSM